eukprot:CAMPEP_0119080098 /NCGR_PEP_ID=MMETSP1178-20130426/110514_1 /TAXON_ID=33656 /ORGANISM="unid sp, Strain CCMP2000" /LENGTH=76 /DNA_ID=CAMNT_0007062669 /DNA_START=44 /DNA_END=272 /DNA_ORIENTATION=-
MCASQSARQRQREGEVAVADGQDALTLPVKADEVDRGVWVEFAASSRWHVSGLAFSSPVEPPLLTSTLAQHGTQPD